MTKLFLIFMAFSLHPVAWAVNDPVRLKNFREIYESYAQITGVDSKDADLLELYKLNVDRLPKLGVAGELSSNVVLATTELAGAFCKKALDKEKALPRGERNLYGLADLTRGPEQFTEYLKGVIVNRFAEQFWQRQATDSEKQVFSKSISKMTEKDPEDEAQTGNILHVLCATFGTSLAFLTK